MCSSCLHKAYIKPTLCLHIFGHLYTKSLFSKTNRVRFQLPIKPNQNRHLVNVTINASIKFSREFYAYLPVQQSLVSIYRQNSLENLSTTLIYRTCEAVSFIVPVPLISLRRLLFVGILKEIMQVLCRLYVGFMQAIKAVLRLIYSGLQ